MIVLVVLLGVALHPGASSHPGQPAGRSRVVTDTAFALVVDGRSATSVAAVLGAPARSVESVAVSDAGPEATVVCWYYPSVDQSREFHVCFIDDRVVSRGSSADVQSEQG